MSGLIFKKVNTLPSTYTPNTVYMVKEGNDTRIYVSSADGSKVHSTVSKATTVDFSRYDLPVAVTTGELDLSKNQVFQINLSTAGIRNITFANAPSRAMVVILETIGNVGSIQFPATLKNTEGSDQTIGASKSIITLFWDGSTMFFMSNGQIAA